VTRDPATRATPRGSAAPDAALVTAVALLAGFGLVMIHSATAPFASDGTLGLSPHFVRHATAVAAAAAAGFAVSRLPLPVWRHLALPMWACAVVLLVATLADGVTVNGARRWLALPALGVRFQPAEPAKLATVLAVAALLGRRDEKRPNSPSRLWAPALVALVPAGLLVAQPDLGNAVLVLLLVAAMLFVAGTPLRAFTWPVARAGAGLGAYVATRAYAWSRLTGFLDPWSRADSEGFQLVQSFVGFARGGVWGVGVGDGRQKLFYLPEAHTDFILAVVAEETGLVGVLFVLGSFAALALAGLRIARRARDRFALLLAFGATLLLVVPAVLNTAVVTGSVPTKGLPLPFLSYGRTALLAGFVAVGLLMAVARRAQPEPRRFRR
jgi:cell division protein FtsW